MQEELPAGESPVVLIASGDEWLARSIESILSPGGIAVVKALTGKQTLEYARSKQPDAILLESRLPDIDSLELCRALRSDPRLPATVPIIMATVAPSRRRDRLEALRAGAWDYCDILPDTDELLLRLDTYLRLKVATDRIRKESLQDELTGLYNLRGLMRKLQELGSDALRHHRPLACLAIAPEFANRESGRNSIERTEKLGRLVTDACRASDAIARLPSNEFVVLAPETAPPGAQRLAERVIHAAEQLEEANGEATATTFRVGYFAVWDFTTAAIQPIEMLMRATTALHASRGSASRIVGFEPGQPSPS